MKLLNPKPGTLFGKLNERLALFHDNEVGAEYWTQYWTPEQRKKLLDAGLAGDLGVIKEPLDRYVRTDLPVLDAGCGPGSAVAAMRFHGYQAFGIDYDKDVVTYVNNTAPELNVVEGDILNLEVEPNSLGCYLSLGVLEHFEDGPLVSLKEARRVLHPDGVALISVPYLNTRRANFLNIAPGNSDLPTDVSFHQYYFSENEFREHLAQAGLSLISVYPYGSAGWFAKEHPVFSRLLRSRVATWRVKKLFKAAVGALPRSIRLRYAHMALFVAKPN